MRIPAVRTRGAAHASRQGSLSTIACLLHLCPSPAPPRPSVFVVTQKERAAVAKALRDEQGKTCKLKALNARVLAMCRESRDEGRELRDEVRPNGDRLYVGVFIL